MRTNPGGGLAPEEVVGRDALIADLGVALDDELLERNVVLVAQAVRVVSAQPPGRAGPARCPALMRRRTMFAPMRPTPTNPMRSDIVVCISV